MISPGWVTLGMNKLRQNSNVGVVGPHVTNVLSTAARSDVFAASHLLTASKRNQILTHDLVRTRSCVRGYIHSDSAAAAAAAAAIRCTALTWTSSKRITQMLLTPGVSELLPYTPVVQCCALLRAVYRAPSAVLRSILHHNGSALPRMLCRVRHRRLVREPCPRHPCRLAPNQLSISLRCLTCA